MFPFTRKIHSTNSPNRERPADRETTPKVSFRPPTLTAISHVTDPFERVGPRLRVMEFFDRELSR
jgi:hypothetical protein